MSTKGCPQISHNNITFCVGALKSSEVANILRSVNRITDIKDDKIIVFCGIITFHVEGI